MTPAGEGAAAPASKGPVSLEERLHLTAVARGEVPADCFIRGATLVNVYSGELLPAHVALASGHIAYVGRQERAVGPGTEIVQAEGLYLSPAWIEPHSHPWLLYNPVSLVEGILPGGTSLVFNDSFVFQIQAGAAGFRATVEALSGLPLRYRWLVRILSRGDIPDRTDPFLMEELEGLLGHEDVAGTAEVTRWPLVYQGDPHLLTALGRAREAGKRTDGHTAGASWEKLNAVVTAGISACHESISREQVLDRLRLGLWTALRHSSLRPDLPVLAEALVRDGVDSRRLMLTVDGPSPRFLAEEGFIDEALRQAVRAGVPPVQAIQMATLNPATFFGMDQEVGGIAPGRRADLVLLPDLESFRPRSVLVGGREVAREGRLLAGLPQVDWEGLGMRPGFASVLAGRLAEGLLAPSSGEELPVVRFISNVITGDGGRVGRPSDGGFPPGLLLGVLLDRQGSWATRGWIQGLASSLEGLATTFNTSGQLLVLGRSEEAMQRAALWVLQRRGGIAFARRDGVDWGLELPIAGMMSTLPFAAVVEAQQEIDARFASAGFPFRDTLYSLLFLTCDFLPGLRLTGRGVLDVKSGRVVREADLLAG